MIAPTSPASMATHSASAAMPPFPGAHQIFSTRGLSFSFHTSACSRPPPPRTRTFILIPRRRRLPNDRRRSHTCQLAGVDSRKCRDGLNGSSDEFLVLVGGSERVEPREIPAAGRQA